MQANDQPKNHSANQSRGPLRKTWVASAALLACIAHPSMAQDHGAADLAKQLSNPISSLISLPFQLNYDQDMGAQHDGHRYTLNVQPVIPISISEDWNLISRTIVPVIQQDDVIPGTNGESGLGDVVQSVFFSPKAPTSSGLIWGVGPVFLLPTATDDLLGTEKWGAGPTGVVLKQAGHVTFGALANHIWSFAGESDRADVSATFFQPFFSYTTPTAWSFTLQAESTYDWKSEEWNIPIGMFVSKVTKFGSQPVQFQIGPRYYAEHTENGPRGWGFRAGLVFMFPK
ncbi:transporter [Cellvibrio sp. NN19]|uniref:transporter n=1 Tax=Cellvibrio chitinivorans TaxID=3102792 RepID=UPI002B4014D8|nr:transporter [Cellvibrio sp. NN19]